MDNTYDEAWDKAQLAEWAKFWNTDLGQAYLAKLRRLKESHTNSALTQDTAEKVMGMAGRAAGIGLVIDDIETGILAAHEASKKEDTAAVQK